MQPPLPYDELQRELDRIGADSLLRGGLATGPGVTPEDVRAAFRATADGAGTEGFIAALRAEVAARRAREAQAGGSIPPSGA